MPWWKRRKTKAAVKWIKAKNTVLNEGRIIFYPSIRPGSAKRVFELASYQAGRNETYTACQRDGLNPREGTVHERPKSAPCQDERRQQRKGDREPLQPDKDGLIRNVAM
jgi:hypothetical protein